MPRSESYLEISGSSNRNDHMVWPDPADPEEVEWSIRHAPHLGREVTRGQELTAASYMHAYRALIAMPQKLRNQRIEQIKHASAQAETRRQEGKNDGNE